MHDEAAGVIHTKPTWTKYEALSSKGKSSTDTQRAEGHTRRIMEQLGSMAFVQEFQALSSRLRDPDEVCMSRDSGAGASRAGPYIFSVVPRRVFHGPAEPLISALILACFNVP